MRSGVVAMADTPYFPPVPISAVAGLNKALEARTTQSDLNQALLNRVTNTELEQRLFVLSERIAELENAAASDTAPAAAALPSPMIRLDSVTMSKLYFDNRPAGATVCVYKYAKPHAGPHIWHVRQNRTYAVLAATTGPAISVIEHINYLPDTVDGVSMLAGGPGRFVLVKNEDNPLAVNGIYELTTPDSTVVELSALIPENSAVVVESGTANAGTVWIWTAPYTYENNVTVGRTVYSAHLGKRFRLLENLGSVDSWDAAGYFEPFGKSGSYQFAYAMDAMPGPVSARLLLLNPSGSPAAPRWRF